MKNIIMTEICPYCGKPTSTQETNEEELMKALLSDEQLKVSAPCLMCAGHKPNYMVVSQRFKKKYNKLLEDTQ